MIPELPVEGGRQHTHTRGYDAAHRWFAVAALSIVFALSVLRFCYLSADFPNNSPWMIDPAKFTDEGWWANAAVRHCLLGQWNLAGDYNPAVAVPVWPALLGIVFHFTGVSVVAARALNVAISIATLGVVFLLVRRYTGGKVATPAILAVLLLAASPFAFFFSRLAILDTLVLFEFCLLLLVASFASLRRIWPLLALPLLVGLMILTKTTAALLVPPVFWLAWKAMDFKLPGFLRAVLAVALVPAALLKAYAALASVLGYGDDFHYFFSVNAMPDIDWGTALSTLSGLLHNCFWVDRFLYPAGLLILPLSLVGNRKLWHNPLFTASWIALASQAAFIFSRQDDYAPRYFLAMLAPLVFIVVLAFAELASQYKRTAAVVAFVLALSAAANIAMIVQFLLQRQYQFRDAANSIRGIVTRDPSQKQLILGVSGNQISLMTGIPSINDGYGTQDTAQNVSRYQPGWYLVWNDIVLESQPMLAPFRLEEVASYPVFDDDERTTLILYKMTPRASPAPSAQSTQTPP